MVLVFLVVLTVILGTLAVASRSSFGLLGSAFQLQSREARSAAELGANWVISELNKVGNRTLLVNYSNPSTGNPNETALVAPSDNLRWGSIGTIPNNPCASVTTGTGSSAKTTITPPTLTNLDPDSATAGFQEWFILENGTVTATRPVGGNYRSFRITGVARPSQAGNQANEYGLKINTSRNTNLANSGTQPFLLSIEGMHYRNGAVVARTTLEKEYELVPKCCGRTFGGAHGNDVYSADNKLGNDASGNPLEGATCFPQGLLGYGLVAGAGPGTGSVNLNGKVTITTGTADIDPIICLFDDASKCTYSTTGSNVPSVSLVQGNLGLPETFSEATGISPAPSPQPIKACNSATDCPSNLAPTGTSSTTTFTTYNGGGGKDEFTNKNTTYVNVNSVTSANLPSNCAFTNSEKILHCNVSTLSPTDPIVFRTSTSKELRLYFPNGNTTVIDVGGNTSIENRNCGATDFKCSRPSLSDNPPYPITTLSMYGCVTSGCGPQTIKMNGTPATLFTFMWFPYGTLDMSGTSDVAGVIWSESLSLSGTPTVTVPGSGLGDVSCQLGLTSCASNPTPTGNTIAFDQVARATNRFRFIGN